MSLDLSGAEHPVRPLNPEPDLPLHMRLPVSLPWTSSGGDLSVPRGVCLHLVPVPAGPDVRQCPALPRLLQSMRRTALAMELLLHTVEREIPDTAATVRLSGLEMADAIQEVSLLG